MDQITRALKDLIGKENVLIHEPMLSHTSFRVGGPAEFFLTPDTEDRLRSALQYLKKYKIPYFVMGKGSNLLVSDAGVRGAVIQLGPKLSSSHVENDCIYAQTGASLSFLAALAAEAGLTGLEFASGIPGSLGGALFMNAGAYDGEMKQVVSQVTVLTKEGNVQTLSCEEMCMGYRKSILGEKEYTALSAVLQLHSGDKDAIHGKMKELNQKRREKQPLEFPSAGSTFKRPEGYFAGKLIEDAGLKGYSIGGAQVSEKHAGFIINKGNATANDIYSLIMYCIAAVEKQFQVTLSPEVRFVGTFHQ